MYSARRLPALIRYASDGSSSIGVHSSHRPKRSRVRRRIAELPPIKLSTCLRWSVRVYTRCHLSRLNDSTRSEEHTSELQSRGLISYAVFCLKKKKRW